MTLGNVFERVARDAGVRVRIGKEYNMSQHEMRDLLKSTLISSGCRYDAADHAIGHKPKDSYEKQAILYPETMRAEYAKAAEKINVLESSQKAIDAAMQQDTFGSKITKGIAEELEYHIHLEKQQETERVDEDFRATSAEKKLEERSDTINGLQKKMDVLQEMIERISKHEDSNAEHSMNLPLPAIYNMEKLQRHI